MIKRPELRSQILRERADRQLEPIEDEEVLAWLKHPLTISLRLRLEADIEGIKEEWSNGTYASEAENAKAIGMVQTANDYAEWFLEINEKEDEEEDV